MSRIVAEPGSFVRQGQLIGYVGSSGLSTGPHLHYEVYRGGEAVNPLSVRFAGAPPVDGADIAAFKARLKALLSGWGEGLAKPSPRRKAGASACISAVLTRAVPDQVRDDGLRSLRSALSGRGRASA